MKTRVNVMALVILALFILFGSVSATTYHECGSMVCDDSEKLILGGSWFVRFDGQLRPLSEAKVATTDWTYRVTEDKDYYYLERLGETLKLPKDGMNYSFSLDRVSFSITKDDISTSKTPYSVSLGEGNWATTKSGVLHVGDFIWDNDISLVMSNGSRVNLTNPKFTIVDNKLNFDANLSLAALSLKKIEFHSYIISGSGGNTSWGAGTFNNMVEKASTKELQLAWNVSDWVVYYSFDEGSGSTAIGQNKTINGTISGATRVVGKYHSALNFTGSNYVSLGNPSALNNLAQSTYALWVYPLARTNDGLEPRLMDKEYMDFGEEVGNGLNPNFCHSGDSESTEVCRDCNINSLTLNAWNHVTATWNGSKSHLGIHIYINGVECSYNASNDEDITGTIDDDSSVALWIGNRVYDSARPTSGYIDEVSIFNRVLTVNEISQLMNNTHITPGNWSSGLINLSGISQYARNITANFTSNGQPVDLYYKENLTWVKIASSISNGTTYAVNGSNYTFYVLLNTSTSNKSKTIEVQNIAIEPYTPAGGGGGVYEIVTLNQPTNGTSFPNGLNNVSLNFTVTGSNSTYNCSLGLNNTLNQSIAKVSNNSISTFNLSSIGWGFWLWNVTCTANSTLYNNSLTWSFTTNAPSSCTVGNGCGSCNGWFNITVTVPPYNTLQVRDSNADGKYDQSCCGGTVNTITSS